MTEVTLRIKSVELEEGGADLSMEVEQGKETGNALEDAFGALVYTAALKEVKRIRDEVRAGNGKKLIEEVEKIANTAKELEEED